MAKANRSKNVLKTRVLLVSGLLVVFSITGAYLLIEQSRVTETYLIAKVNLPSGTPLSEDLLSRVELSLFASGKNYLVPEVSLDSSYLVRSVSAGEVIPLSAITTAQLDDYANLVITPTLRLSSKLAPGSLVSLWSSPRLDYQSFGEPTLLAVDVEVVAITEPEGGFSGDQDLVEVRVPQESIQYLLRSVANGDSLALVGAGESLGG